MHPDVPLYLSTATPCRNAICRDEANQPSHPPYQRNLCPLAVQNGEVVDRLEGANAPELAHKVALHISAPNAAPGSSSGVGATASPAEVINNLQDTLAHPSGPAANGIPTAPLTNGSHAHTPASGLTPELKARLEKLVSSQPVLLFMKGTPEEPRCGFSSKVVAALREVGVPFGSFDILSDEEVRAGLKVFSDWPTFPQLYAEGELVGGCDIVLEMHRSGELRKLLEKVPGAGEASKGEGAQDLNSKLKKLIASSPTMLFMKVRTAPQMLVINTWVTTCGYSQLASARSFCRLFHGSACCIQTREVGHVGNLEVSFVPTL